MSERPSFLARLLRPIVQLRDGEATTALLMFLYSFLAMTSYNIIKPITRSEFISSLGADNLPVRAVRRRRADRLHHAGLHPADARRCRGAGPSRSRRPASPRCWCCSGSCSPTIGQDWIAVAFYIVGLILAVLLISQFWTLANDVYDPRQAKRIFGFIGGGASLGGATGAALTAFLVAVDRRAEHAAARARRSWRRASRSSLFVLRREEAAGTSDADEDRRGERHERRRGDPAAASRRATCRSSRW